MGTTWLMKEFGTDEYASIVYINFDNNERMKMLFRRKSGSKAADHWLGIILWS